MGAKLIDGAWVIVGAGDGAQPPATPLTPHDVHAHGVECPDDVTLAEMRLDKFMAEFDKDAEWVAAPEA